MEEVNDSKPSTDVKDSKPSTDAKDSKLSTDIKDSKPSTDVKDSKPSTDVKDSKLSADVKDSKLSTDIKDSKISSDVKDSKPSTDAKDSKLPSDVKDSKPSTDVKDSKPSTDAKDSKPSTDVKDSKLSADVKVSKPSTDVKDSKPSTEVKNSKPSTISYGDILADFHAFGEDIIKFLPHYSDVEQVILSEYEDFTEHNLYAILHCITKMKKVKKVEVIPCDLIEDTLFELLEEAGFEEETCEEVDGASAKTPKARWMTKTATPKATLPSKRLIISRNEMAEMSRKDLLTDAKGIEEIKIFHFDKPATEEFSNFLRHFQHLGALQLSGNGFLTDDHLKAIGENLHQLRKLCIHMEGFIRDEGICFLTGNDDASEANCPSLNNLAIYGRHNITKKSVEKMKNKLMKLENLLLWMSVDEEVIKYTSTMQSLKSVTFRYSDRIDIIDFIPSLNRMKEAGFTKYGVDGEIDCDNTYITSFYKPS